MIFEFNNKKYFYFYNLYNNTKQNERCIEVPIVWDIVRKTTGRILEVGNVLSHYFDVDYDIIDKNEKAKGVINIDVNDFKPEVKYDLIVCISTLEHVSEDPEVLMNTFNHLKFLLSTTGKLVITFPIGQNKTLDTLLKNNNFLPMSIFYMKRFGKYNNWKQSDYDAVKDSQHCRPFPSGNGIVIMIFN